MERVILNITKGALSLSNGDKYEGEWKNDKKNGLGNFQSIVGVQEYPNNDKYRVQ